MAGGEFFSNRSISAFRISNATTGGAGDSAQVIAWHAVNNTATTLRMSFFMARSFAEISNFGPGLYHSANCGHIGGGWVYTA